jgi:hypothetical protein
MPFLKKFLVCFLATAFTSGPVGADVLVAGEFVGNCPAALKLAPAKHTVTVRSAGYQDWSRDITVAAGSNVQLTATLDR